MSNESAKILGEALKQNKSLEKLRLNFVFFKDQIIENLLPRIAQCKQLVELDLSANKLSDKHAVLISKIITVHTERLEELVWSYGLRGGKPPLAEI